MPSMPYRATITGLSSTFGFPIYAPDYFVRPFNVTASVVMNSTASAPSYNIEFTQDYTGSSAFISSNATWFSSILSAQASNAAANFNFPVTGLRLNVTAGPSQQTANLTFVQAG